MKKRIVLADINSYCSHGRKTGHGFAVAENFLRMADKETEIVIVGGPSYAERFAHAVILDYDADSDFSALENKRRNLHNIRQLFRLFPHDTIVFQSNAVVTCYMGIALFKPKTCRVLMIHYSLAALESRLKRCIYHLAADKIDGIICPEAEIGETYGLPYCVVPDYIYSGEPCLPPAPYQEKEYDFCMVGLICADKGIIEAASVLAGSPYRVLVAGKAATPDIEKRLNEIAQAGSNIELRLRYLSEDEYADALRKSRYCILNYQGAYSLHSSGVVFDTLFSGVPVVGRRCKALSFIEETGTGLLLDKLSQEKLGAVLCEKHYNAFRSQIERYVQTHQEHRRKLLQFVNMPA